MVVDVLVVSVDVGLLVDVFVGELVDIFVGELVGGNSGPYGLRVGVGAQFMGTGQFVGEALGVTRGVGVG